MEVNEQQFEYQKKLAELGVQIAKASSELKKLYGDKDKFLQTIKDEAISAQKVALATITEVTDNIKSKKNELEEYCHAITDYGQELLQQRGKLEKDRAEFEQKAGEVRKTIENKQRELIELSNRVAIDVEAVKAKKELLVLREKTLTSGKKHLDSQREALKIAFQELKKKTIKI